MDRALFYAVVVGGIYSILTLLVLNNVPIAVFSGAIIGFLALLRGIAVWG